MGFQSKAAFRLLSLACTLLLVPLPARGDSFIPTLGLLWPAAWLVLIPVILVEALVAERVLGMGYGAACRAVGAANLRSTLIGIPVTGLLMAAVQVWTLIAIHPATQSPFGGFAVTTLVLTEYAEEWMIPASAIFYSVPFLFMSVYVERRSMETHFSDEARSKVRRWAWQANALSYGLIEVGLGIMVMLALKR
jgi:hypothetical protein